MKKKFRIGRAAENDIVITDENCSNFYSEINYEKGNWILNNLELRSNIVNGIEVESNKKISKYDKINVCGQIIYWSNYLYEGDNQELKIRDFLSLDGKISKANFRAITIFVLGLSILIFFLPGMLVTLWAYIGKKFFKGIEFDSIVAIQQTAPFLYTIGYTLLGVMFLLLASKRIRDTGNSLWKLFLPVYNLKLLFFHPSKK